MGKGLQKTGSKKFRHAVMPREMVFGISKKGRRNHYPRIIYSGKVFERPETVKFRDTEVWKDIKQFVVGCFVKSITPNKS